MAFERVKTARQQKAFERTWEYFCRKYGWCNDPYAADGVRYVLLSPETGWFRRKKVIGTIEFIPYDPKNPHSTVEKPGICEFAGHEEIRFHQNRVWEIDKLCLHEDYQRKRQFQQFMSVFHDHALRHQPKYYLALIEKKFFRMLRITLGLGVKQKAESLPGPTTELIPMVFDIGHLMQDEAAVRKLLGSQ